MSKSENKVIIIGNLTADPELKYTAGNNTAVAKLRVATNEQYTDKTGAKQEKTQFHQVIAWAKLAETCGQYLKKGQQVYLEGKIEYRSYDKDGVKVYVTEIIASNVIFLGGKPGGAAAANSAPASTTGGAPAAARGGVVEDDIPF